MNPVVLQLVREFAARCKEQDAPPAVGMLVSEEAFTQLLYWLENELQRPLELETNGDLPTVNGVPFHVQEGLQCQAVFFTDAQVWSRVLQHTDQ